MTIQADIDAMLVDADTIESVSCAVDEAATTLTSGNALYYDPLKPNRSIRIVGELTECDMSCFGYDAYPVYIQVRDSIVGLLVKNGESGKTSAAEGFSDAANALRTITGAYESNDVTATATYKSLWDPHE